MSGNDIYYGASFSKPISFPRGFGIGMLSCALCWWLLRLLLMSATSPGVRFASHIDPGIKIDWQTDTPSFLSPLLCSMNEITGPGLTEFNAKKRRKHYKDENHR